ncbi:MAG: hypothetical protein AAGK78_03345 [Planctomycetota bacterium]
MTTAKGYLRRRARWTILTLAAIAVISTAAVAQPAGSSSQPSTTRAADPADAVLDRLLQESATEAEGERLEARRTVDYDRTTGRGDLAVAPNTTPQRLLPEGSFVVDRPGRVRETTGGNLEFVFDADGQTTDSAGDPPMVLVPNLNLQALEGAWNADTNRRFRITGRVTEYRGRNHLVLEKVVVLR